MQVLAGNSAAVACAASLGCAVVIWKGCGSGLRVSAQAEPEDVVEFKAKRDKSCRDPEGWLTLVGLHWLRSTPEGSSHTVGTRPNSDVILAAAAPPLVGTISIDGSGAVTFTSACPVELEDDAGRKALSEGACVQMQHAPKPSLLRVGTVLLMLIKRDGVFALRVKDSTCAVLANFTGMK